MANGVKIEFAGDEVKSSKYNTVSDIIGDTTLASQLGFSSDRVTAYVNGVAHTGSLADGDVVKLVVKANEKG